MNGVRFCRICHDRLPAITKFAHGNIERQAPQQRDTVLFGHPLAAAAPRAGFFNALADRGRRDASRMAHAHVSLEDDVLALPSAEPAQDERVAHQQALMAVRTAVLRLPPRCREVYLLNRIEDMSYTEIARHCGISVKAVEKHIGKALSLLRVQLRSENGGHTDWP